MSSECLTWAIRAKVGKSSLKVLLLILADLANHDTSEVFASIAYLEDNTELSKKTIIAGLQEFERLGIIERTGEMKGRSGQIPVYHFDMPANIKLATRRGGKLHRSDRPVEKGALTGGKTTPGPVENCHTEPSNRNQDRNQGIPSLPSVRPSPEEGLFEIVGSAPGISLADYVLAEWKKLSDQYPAIQAIRVLNDSRQKKIGARAAEVLKGCPPGVSVYDVWDQIFQAVHGSTFLRGEDPPSRNYPKPFSLSIDFLLRPAQFIQTLERAASNARHNAATSNPVTGRRFGPAEQAGRDALAAILAARKQG